VDMPTSHLHTDEFVAVAREVAAEVGAAITVLQRDTLPAEFGGLWGVGQAAAHPPALVILEYSPKTAPAQTIVMVGKGYMLLLLLLLLLLANRRPRHPCVRRWCRIVYDTGGLSIKEYAV
jgi:leucyl aminopeptidase